MVKVVNFMCIFPPFKNWGKNHPATFSSSVVPSCPLPCQSQLKRMFTCMSVGVGTYVYMHMCLRIQYMDSIFLNGILYCLELRHQNSNLQICFSSRMLLGDSTLSKTSVVDIVCEVASFSSGSRFHGRGEKKSSLRAQGRGYSHN